jgi:hypothetical protein
MIPLTVSVLVFRRVRRAPAYAFACGIILLAWVVTQFVILPFNPTSAAYFVFGSAQAIMAGLWWRAQNHLHITTGRGPGEGPE